MSTYALCGNLYTETIAKIHFKNELLLIHRSNKNTLLGKAYQFAVFIAAVLFRYAICAPANVEFSIAAPHLCNRYKLIFFILRPDKIWLIDDGITFEYWSEFHENNIMSILRLPSISGMIGPKVPVWPVDCLNIPIIIIPRADIVCHMVGKKFYVESINSESIKNDRMVCVLDDGAIELEHLNKLADDFKTYCNATFCHVIFHPSRVGTKHSGSAEEFILEPDNKVVAVYGNGSTTLFNVISFNKNIKVYSQAVSADDLLKSLEDSGIEITPWGVLHGFQ